MINLLWSKNGAKDFLYIKENMPELLPRISELLGDIRSNPYSGVGAPVPLTHGLAGYWSRRIDRVNRLVYKVNGTGDIIIAQCRFHS